MRIIDRCHLDKFWSVYYLIYIEEGIKTVLEVILVNIFLYVLLLKWNL